MAAMFHGTNRKIAWYHADCELNTRMVSREAASDSGPIAAFAKARTLGQIVEFICNSTCPQVLHPDWGSHRHPAFRSVRIVQDSQPSTRTAGPN
ncbi:hypothetical protein CEE69_03560 [Rhodopirellula bahusiensis]|uniref:Uncharacterized protein n=1 Tax=Rhodopirellula bahusiensis TaxID=2014065 RepID=A0A2G1WBR1_9BACT|nr:hypothetical protein CEE69_03560 [Rhodopirellula bahusiensis]